MHNGAACPAYLDSKDAIVMLRRKVSKVIGTSCVTLTGDDADTGRASAKKPKSATKSATKAARRKAERYGVSMQVFHACMS